MLKEKPFYIVIRVTGQRIALRGREAYCPDCDSDKYFTPEKPPEIFLYRCPLCGRRLRKSPRFKNYVVNDYRKWIDPDPDGAE